MDAKQTIITSITELIESAKEGDTIILNKPVLDTYADKPVSTDEAETIITELFNEYAKEGYSVQKIESVQGTQVIINVLGNMGS